MPRILMVDDDEMILTSGEKILRALGHEVVTAIDGLEGAKRLKNESFDVVITDMRMPGLDGMGVIEAAHKFCPTTRIIASGGCGSLPALDPAIITRRWGVHAMLPKPYGMRDLEAAIAEALEAET